MENLNELLHILLKLESTNQVRALGIIASIANVQRNIQDNAKQNPASNNASAKGDVPSLHI